MKSFKNLDILYIEDNIETRNNYAKTFKLLFNKVYVASNYEEAINTYKEEISLLLVDIELKKDKNGFDIANKIRSLNENIPIVFFTGHDEKDFILKAINSNMNGYIIKPLNLEKLFEILNNLFKKQNNSSLIYFDKFIYNFETCELFDKKNSHISLGKKENELLKFFLQNKNRLLSREVLEFEIWNEPLESDSTLKNLIASLRKKIGKDLIINISKIGWKIQID